MATSPPAGQTRRHKVRGTGGKFAKAESPHHGAVQSTYERAQLSRTRDFSPDKESAVTPQDGGRK